MNPSLTARLRLVFGVLLLLLVIVATVGVGQLFQLRQDFEEGSSDSYTLELAGERLRSSFILEQSALRMTDDRARAIATTRSARGSAAQTARLVVRLSGDDATATRLARARLLATQRWRRAIADPILRGESPRGSNEALARPVIEADRRLVALQAQRRSELRDSVRADTRTTVLFVLLSLLAAMLAAMVLFSGVVASMRKPLSDLVSAARNLARGDLSARAEVGGPVETETLGRAFNDMATDLSETYRRVEEERARLATMIASLGDGLITVNPSGTVTLVNPAAREMLPSAVPGAPLREALGDLSLREEQLQRIVAADMDGELRLSGAGHELAVRVAPLETRAGGTVLSIRDVTERARVERMKDDFVATVSHELRSPLTSIKGFAELLLIDEQALTRDQLENMRVIDESTGRLVELVNDLLDLARSDSGRLSIVPRPTPVADLVVPAIRLIEPRAKSKGQTVELALEDDLPQAWADPGRIRQVMTNLVTNAHNYSPRGAHIEVAAREVAGAVQITVSDDGPGIPPDQQKRLFERFWRGEAGERQAVGGSGLGLPIARSLVELHSGEITVDSEPGVGTSFHVVLPTEAEGAPVSLATPRSALLLEEDPVARGLLQHHLRAAGLEPVTARSAQDAADRLRRTQVDVCILGLRGDHPTALPLLEALRRHAPTDQLPVMVVSLLPGRARERGERDAVAPLPADEVAVRLDAELERGRQVIVVAADPRLRAQVNATYASHGSPPRLAGSALEAVTAARTSAFDLVLIDREMPSAEAAFVAIQHGWADGPEPRAILFDEVTANGQPPTISLAALAERAARLAEGIDTATTWTGEQPAVSGHTKQGPVR